MSNNKRELTRRKFLATAGLASVSLAAGVPKTAFGDTPITESEPVAGDIIYRQLGRSEISVPVVSMGAARCTDPGLIQASYEQGIRHYETAANYQFGANEQLIGKVIERMGVRDEVVIATKIYTPNQRRDLDLPQLKKKLSDLLDGSLKRLQSDYVDVLYIHDVSTPDIASDTKIMEALTFLKEQGKARAIGLSTHANMTEVISAATGSGFWEAIQTSMNFTMADDAAFLSAIEAAGEKGIGLVAMKTLAGGGAWPNPETRRSYDTATITTALLKWVLSNKNIATVVPAIGDYEQLNLDIGVAKSLEYTEQEKNFLSDNDIRLSLGFCRQCEKCLASCPRGVQIPQLMRTHMYAAQYGDFRLARDTYDSVPKANGLEACISCATCTAQCSNSVDIKRKIEELKLIYA